MPTAPASAVAAETLAQAPPAGAGLPLYRTRVPPSFALGYELRRGASRGSAELQWRLEGDRYEAQLDNHLAGRTATVWRSTGGFDDAGLAPARHTDQRQGRGSHAANFQREAGLVSFSGPRLEVPLPAGVQDRVSWLVQLAAIGAAEPALMSPGATISLFVVGARGDADVWTFTAIDTEVLELPGGPTPAVRLLREPARAWDTRVEVWLAPELHYLPVRARMGNGTESGSLELLLRELSLAR